MSWNFCPWCGHRVYQHCSTGCLHVEHPYRACADTACPDFNPSSHPHGHDVEEPCDCRVAHSLLVGVPHSLIKVVSK